MIKCEWISEIDVAKNYFDKNGWQLTSVEKRGHNFYKVSGGKTNNSTTVYVIEDELYEFDRFRYKKIDD